jgi:hypothetical protein
VVTVVMVALSDDRACCAPLSSPDFSDWLMLSTRPTVRGGQLSVKPREMAW